MNCAYKETLEALLILGSHVSFMVLMLIPAAKGCS